MYNFEGKVALVTGASRKQGIGHATAVRFAMEGANVAVNSRFRPAEQFTDEEKLDGWSGLNSVVEEIEALGGKGLALTADVSDKNQIYDMVEKTIAEFGRIDFLVANAGMVVKNSIIDHKEKDWHLVIATNLDSVFYCCQAVAKHMVERGEGGAIVNMSSVAGKIGFANSGSYVASKFGVNGLTQVLAIELGSYNIRVNAVSPGRILTKLSCHSEAYNLARESGIDVFEAGKTVNADIIPFTPLRRVGSPQEVANVIVFLCSDEASFVTGQSINIDGGRLYH